MDRPRSRYCVVCDVELSGPLPAQQHYSSDKHRRKVQSSQQQPITAQSVQDDNTIPDREFDLSGPKGYCYVCKKELSSTVVAKQHLSGKNPAKAKERWQRAKQEQDFAKVQPTIIGTMSSGSLVPGSPGDGKYIMKVKPKPDVESGRTESKKCYNFDIETCTGMCYACNIDIADFLQLQKHVKSEQHLENEKAWEENNQAMHAHTVMGEAVGRTSPPQFYSPMSINNAKWFQCDVCNIRVNTQLQLKTHEQSPKHLKQLERKRLRENHTPGAADQTIWYQCDHCNKRLNSEQQLMLHKRSHGLKERPLSAPMVKTLAASPSSDLDSTDGQSGETEEDLLSVGLQALKISAKDGGSPETMDIKSDLRPSSSWSHGWLKSSKDSSMNAKPGSPSSSDDDLFGGTGGKESTRDETKIESETKGVTLHVTGIRMRTRLKQSGAKIREDCVTFQCTNHCEECDKHHTGLAPYKQHLQSKKHLKKLAELEAEAKPADDKPFPTFHAYCELCQVPFNTDASATAHYEGKKHKEKEIKASKAPARDLPAIVKHVKGEDCDFAYELTDTVPRSYQLELYEKAMEKDVVCFLPTGTGKTLVSVMVMSHMLRLNPYRPAVFLVDKVLLALQQSNVIRKELGELEFERYDEKERKLVKRELRVALVCGGKQDTQGLPIWQQDVIVATAAYFENLLLEEIVRWEDHCLLVLDESHHCVKDHPYQRLMSDYHAKVTDPAARPKVLGLTASPAGRPSLPDTIVMLHTLLRGLGGVSMAAVEVNHQELTRFRSNTKLDIKKVDLSKQENNFREELQRYLVVCYKYLEQSTNVKNFLQGKDVVRSLSSTDNRTQVTDLLQELEEAIEVCKAQEQQRKVYVESLKIHTKAICSALLAVAELGLSFAHRDLEVLNDQSYSGSFQHAKEMDLPCEMLMETMAKYKQHNNMEIDTPEEFDLEMMPVVKQLIAEILGTGEIEWEAKEGKKRPMALVLVRQRKWAKNLELVLSQVPEFIEKDIQCVSVVGHAAKTSEGMSVRQQDRVMSEIKNHEYQVIVATSIAEEGLDLPECELVVQMDPPNNVKSLVQIRGRARKKHSRFVALCRDEGQVQSLESLQKREGFMIEAVDQIVREQKAAFI